MVRDLEYEEKIILDPEDYEEMLEELRFLECLRAAGVDNWDGYDYAQELFGE